MGQAVSILINYVLSEDSHRVVQLARSKSLRVRIHTMYLLHFYRERQYILCIYIYRVKGKPSQARHTAQAYYGRP